MGFVANPNFVEIVEKRLQDIWLRLLLLIYLGMIENLCVLSWR
jgi:hypothetical protein